MGKGNITGRVVLAVLLCAVLLTKIIPQGVYAGEPPYGSYGVPEKEEYDSFVSEDFNANGSYKEPGVATGALSESDDENGLLDTNDDRYNSIYSGPDGRYKTDITIPEEPKDIDLGSLTPWQMFQFISTYLGFHASILNAGMSEEKKIEQAYYSVIDEQGAVGDLVGNLIYTLASFLDGIFEVAGITVESVIMGRVGGNGVLVDNGTYPGSWDDTVVSLFHFELEKGNPYGVIAALLYSAVRKYMYIVMVLVAFVMVVKAAVKSDTPRSKLELKDRMMSLATALALAVFMPYFLEVFLYLRDILLSGIVGDGILSLFSNGEYGLIDAFRSVCDDYRDLTGSVLWTSALLYLAVECIALVLAAMYIANALSTLLHVVAFPVVCVKSLTDNKAISAWVWEMVGLAAMPIIDGVLLLVPLLFNKMANGSTALNFISLLACSCMLTARQQFRKSIGLQANNMMESGGLMTAIGMSRLISSVGRAGSRAIGQVTGGIKQGASDDAMANFYDAQAQMDKAKTENAEKQIANGYFNSSGGIAINPASLSGMGEEAGASGTLSRRATGAPFSQLSYKQSMFDEANANYDSSSRAEWISGAVNEADIIANDAKTVIGREKDLQAEQVRSVLGRDMPVESENNLYDKFVSVDNFESQEFASKLSNAKKAQMYRQRAQNARKQGFISGALTAGGATLGGVIGFGATAYMDSGTSAMITSAGIDVGAASGNAYKGLSEMRRLNKDANRETIIGGDLSDIHYTIRMGKDVPESEKLKTKDRYESAEPVFGNGVVDAPVDAPIGIEKDSFQAPVETQGYYSRVEDGILGVDEKNVFQTPVETQGYYSRVNDGSIGVDGTRNFDASTGEWYEKADGGPIYQSGKEYSGLKSSAWHDTVTVDMVSTAEGFKKFVKDPVNVEFTNHYAASIGRATDDTYNSDTEMNRENEKRYDAATKLSAEFDSVPRSPQETASYNEKISAYKAQTTSDITEAVANDVNSAMNSFMQDKVLDGAVREALSERIRENSESAIKSTISPKYMKLKGWNYDSLMR